MDAATLKKLEDAICDYGRAEFNAGRADATEYVRMQMAAETKRDQVMAALQEAFIYEEVLHG